jgi:hypothetical protein
LGWTGQFVPANPSVDFSLRENDGTSRSLNIFSKELSSMRKFFNDESGLVVSAELVLVVTLIFTATAVGLAAARDALTQELNDVSEMIGTLDQSYNVSAYNATDGNGKGHGNSNAMGFNDRADLCDCVALTEVETCGKGTGTAGEAGAGPTNL